MNIIFWGISTRRRLLIGKENLLIAKGTLIALALVFIFVMLIIWFSKVTDRFERKNMGHSILSLVVALGVTIIYAISIVVLSENHRGVLEEVHKAKIITVILGLLTYLITQVFYGYSEWRDDSFDMELTRKGKQHKFFAQCIFAIITAAFGIWQFVDWRIMYMWDLTPVVWLGYSFAMVCGLMLIVIIITALRFNKINDIYKIKNTEDNILDPSYWRKIWK
ncbi:hypothetical protein CBG04_09900 [Limosilactobacillus reuteri]|uniref:hypothetical protein n=1 Tax=Limosilactobacillus reuteri TaxID=1598 RepID=UPI000B985A4B|nr:hypothetical protein [Limosilactobacillus reuteri]OYS80619.1 hypothetical protein CBG11_07290 [Limosilactobacillus reuteri]OYS81396.1 hypothetical protein CBG04_09900 [Limosilactobacillus reuteri]OYS83715.1 hypothetical protein CBG14_07250 [Limosilactobacillus reuteri]